MIPLTGCYSALRLNSLHGVQAVVADVLRYLGSRVIFQLYAMLTVEVWGA